MRRSLILASASPRRAELLHQIGVDFCVVPADIDETLGEDETAADYVRRLAVEKARAVASKHPDQVVLAADTTVVAEGHILGKPGNVAELQQMLRRLSGGWHEVLTGIALFRAGTLAQTVTCTRVHFRTINEHEADAYWQTGEPADKAGGYAIQGLGAMFVQRIEGSYSGVVGLPLAETAKFLEQAGITTGLSSQAGPDILNVSGQA